MLPIFTRFASINSLQWMNLLGAGLVVIVWTLGSSGIEAAQANSVEPQATHLDHTQAIEPKDLGDSLMQESVTDLGDGKQAPTQPMGLTSYFDRNSFAKDGVSHFFNPVFHMSRAYVANQQFNEARMVLAPLPGRADAVLPLARSLNEIRTQTNDPNLIVEVATLYRQALAQTPNPDLKLMPEVADVFSGLPREKQAALQLYRQLAASQPNDRSLIVKQLTLESQLGLIAKPDLRSRLYAALQLDKFKHGAPSSDLSCQMQQIQEGFLQRRGFQPAWERF